MKNIKLSMLVAGAALIAAPLAAALPTVYYDIGAGTIAGATVTDGSAGDLFVGTAGLIGSGYSDGNFTIGTTASTKPLNGTATTPQMQSTQIETQGTGTITIYFAESGFGPSSTGFLAQLSATNLSGSGKTITYTTYATTGPLESAPGVLDLTALVGAPMTTLSLPGSGFIQVGGALPFVGTGPYNLIQKIVISQPSGGALTLTANLQNVPDGGTTLALLGASLLGIGAVRRKLTK